MKYLNRTCYFVKWSEPILEKSSPMVLYTFLNLKDHTPHQLSCRVSCLYHASKEHTTQRISLEPVRNEVKTGFYGGCGHFRIQFEIADETDVNVDVPLLSGNDERLEGIWKFLNDSYLFAAGSPIWPNMKMKRFVKILLFQLRLNIDNLICLVRYFQFEYFKKKICGVCTILL